VVDFLYVIIEFFRYLLRLSGDLSKSAFFEGVDHFEAKFYVEGYFSRQYLWTVR